MRWDDLRHLEALVRTGSATAAARELGVATSTVYRRIEALANDVGAPVLLRGADPVELSPEGEHLLALAREMQRGVAELAQQTRARGAEVRGTVRLTTVPGMLPLLVEPLARLAERHSELTVQLELSDSGASVRRRQADVAIGVMARPPTGLIGRRLFRITYGVFGLARDDSDDGPETWVVCGPPMDQNPEAVWERQHAGRVAVATGSRLAFVELVRRGVGIGLLPRPLAALYPELEERAELTESAASLEREAWTLVHADMQHDPSVRALLDELAASLG